MHWSDLSGVVKVVSAVEIQFLEFFDFCDEKILNLNFEDSFRLFLSNILFTCLRFFLILLLKLSFKNVQDIWLESFWTWIFKIHFHSLFKIDSKFLLRIPYRVFFLLSHISQCKRISKLKSKNILWNCIRFIFIIIRLRFTFLLLPVALKRHF